MPTQLKEVTGFRHHWIGMGLTGKALIEDVNAAEVPRGKCAFWWLGQHGFIVKLGGVVAYIDAYLAPDEARTVRPLLKPEEVTNADVIIGTHDHGDHIDHDSWPAMVAASPQALIIVPSFVRESVIDDCGLDPARVVGLDDGVSCTVKGLKITGVPAAHEFLVRHPETGFHEFLGVVLEGNGFTLYHAGDTTVYEGMQARLREWQFDLAFLPINGRDAKRLKVNCIGNMTYQEAVDLAGSIRPGLTVPTHFEMFKMNSEDPQLFIDYIEVKYPGLGAAIPVHGMRTIV